MGKLFLKEIVCFLIIWALMVSHCAAEKEFFYQPIGRTWDEARSHCQACFKDLVTLTVENILTIAQKVTSDSWIGLRKSFYSNSNFTISENSHSTSNSTVSIGMPWSRWANGDPLSFQNWYPGWPVLKSSITKRLGCSSSSTSPEPTTQRVTEVHGLTESNSVITVHFTECKNQEVPNVDSCVAMLSFGAWIEKECSTLLPFICYEDRFFGQANVTNVTSSSAVLTWLPGPGDIDHYRVEVSGQNGILKSTYLTFDLENLTAGSHYSVKVFAVKCGRDLNPQEVDFYSTPNKVLNLTAAAVTETSISLIWTKPAGNVDFYVTKMGEKEIENATEGAEVEGLIPGYLYTFSVLSGVKDRSQWSEESRISAYTRPGKVSDLNVLNNTNTSLVLTWTKPVGNSTSFFVTAVDRDSNKTHFKQEVDLTEVTVMPLPTGSRITLSVRAVVNGTLQGDEVTVHSFTTPAPISKLTLKSEHTNIKASWKPPNGTRPSFTVVLQLDGIDVVTKHNLTVPEEDFHGLKSGASYTVIVYAVRGHLMSPPVKGSKFTLPTSPTDLNVTAFGKNTITLAWQASVHAASSNYSVSINSSFWKDSFEDHVNETSYKFQGLKSGTKYRLRVQMVADEELSAAVTLTHFTEPETREISLSMLCSSPEPLLCDEKSSRESVFRKLKKKMEKKLGDMVFWKLEG